MSLRTITNPSTLTLDLFELSNIQSENEEPLDHSPVSIAETISVFSPPPPRQQHHAHQYNRFFSRIYSTITTSIRHRIHPRTSQSARPVSRRRDESTAETASNIYETAIPLLSASSTARFNLRNPIIMRRDLVSIRRDTDVERRRIGLAIFRSLRRGAENPQYQTPLIELVPIPQLDEVPEDDILNDVQSFSSEGSFFNNALIQRNPTIIATRFSRFSSLRRSIRSVSTGASRMLSINMQSYLGVEQEQEVYEAEYYPAPTDQEQIVTQPVERAPVEESPKRKRSIRFTIGRSIDLYKMLGSFEEHYEQPAKKRKKNESPPALPPPDQIEQIESDQLDPVSPIVPKFSRLTV